MKKWIAVVLAVLLICSLVACEKKQNENEFDPEDYDITGSCGEGVMWGYDTETNALTIGGEGTMDDYSDEVTAPWDEYREEIESVTILNGVKNVGACAFYCYEDLTNVVIGSRVQEIGEYAFGSCDGITEIVLPDALMKIGSWAFQYCDGLTKVVVPDHVTIIGHSAFYSCSNLSEITLGSSVQTIYERAFAETAISEIFIPESVLSIQNRAFSRCDNLKEITVAFENENYKDKDGVLYTKDEGAILQYPCCREESGYYELPDTVTTIGDYAFADSGLSIQDLPEGLTSIGNYAFEGCDLWGLDLPEGLTTIGEYAFSESDLFSVTIPASVTEIGEYAFAYCADLYTVTFAPGANVLTDNMFYDCTYLKHIYVPVSLVGKDWSYNLFGGLDHCPIFCVIHYEGTQEQWDEAGLQRKFSNRIVEFECSME